MLKVRIETKKKEVFIEREVEDRSMASILKACDIDVTKRNVCYKSGDAYVKFSFDPRDVAQFNKHVADVVALYIRLYKISRKPTTAKSVCYTVVFFCYLYAASFALLFVLNPRLAALVLVPIALNLSQKEPFKTYIHDWTKPNAKANYAAEEDALRGAGFTDEKRIKTLLTKFAGDTKKVIEALLK